MVSKNKNHQKSRSPVKVLLVALIVVLLAGGAGYALFSGGNEAEDTPSTETKDVSTNPKPETKDQEIAAPTTNKKSVEPVITFAGARNDNVEVRSYVAEVYESTGKCTATFTKGSAKISRTVEGIKDATYTRCDRVVVPVSEFGSSVTGWTVTITYNSPTAYGVSDPSEVTVP